MKRQRIRHGEKLPRALACGSQHRTAMGIKDRLKRKGGMK